MAIMMIWNNHEGNITASWQKKEFLTFNFQSTFHEKLKKLVQEKIISRQSKI